MSDWEYSKLLKQNEWDANAESAQRQSLVNAARKATQFSQVAPQKINTGDVGADIGQYYLKAVMEDPRLDPIKRNISGRLPGDVKTQLAQSAAERGVSMGSYGSPNSESNLLRSLGLTSLDLTNKGIGQYGDLVAGVPKLSPESLFINPTSNAQMNLQRELSAEDRAAALERLQLSESGATGRAAMSEAGANSRSAAGLGESRYRFDATRGDAAASNAATSRMIDSILNRNRNSWGGSDIGGGYSPTNDAWSGGGGDFFNYLGNFDPNLSGGAGSTAPSGGARSFSVDDNADSFNGPYNYGANDYSGADQSYRDMMEGGGYYD